MAHICQELIIIGLYNAVFTSENWKGPESLLHRGGLEGGK